MSSEILRMLCTDPNGNISIHGSEEDRRLMGIAIKNVEALENQLEISLRCLHFIAQNEPNHQSGRLCTETLERIGQVTNDQS